MSGHFSNVTLVFEGTNDIMCHWFRVYCSWFYPLVNRRIWDRMDHIMHRNISFFETFSDKVPRFDTHINPRKPTFLPSPSDFHVNICFYARRKRNWCLQSPINNRKYIPFTPNSLLNFSIHHSVKLNTVVCKSDVTREILEMVISATPRTRQTRIPDDHTAGMVTNVNCRGDDIRSNKSSYRALISRSMSAKLIASYSKR
jgi:hypothetical protein